MCRLLCVRADRAVNLRPHLEAFAALSRDSKEYQGHGWGCAWRDGQSWRFYHNIRPIWEDDVSQIPPSRLLLVHARSAFRDEGICVENNMPFHRQDRVFLFNGELRGVRIKEQGRIGAEKVFNYVLSFDHGDLSLALARGVDVIAKRSRYIRAMNILLADADNVLVASQFGEDPDYFQMHRTRRPGLDLICSQPYLGETDWQPIPNGTVATADALFGAK